MESSYVDENPTSNVEIDIVNVVAPDENVKKSKEENGGNAWKVNQAGIYSISYDKLREGQKDIDYATLIAEDTIEKKPGFKRHPNYTNKEVREMREAEVAKAEAEAREGNNQ